MSHKRPFLNAEFPIERVVVGFVGDVKCWMNMGRLDAVTSLRVLLYLNQANFPINYQSNGFHRSFHSQFN